MWQDELSNVVCAEKMNVQVFGIDALSYAAAHLRQHYSAEFSHTERVWIADAATLCTKFSSYLKWPVQVQLHENAHVDLTSSPKSLCLCTDQCFIKITLQPNFLIKNIHQDVQELLVGHALSECGHVQVLELCQHDCFCLREVCNEPELIRLSKFLINAIQILFSVDLMYTDIKLENVGITIENKFCLLDLESIMPYTNPTQPCSATFVPDKMWVLVPRLQQRLPFYGAACTFVDLANSLHSVDRVDPVRHKDKLERCIQHACKNTNGLQATLFTVALMFLQIAYATHPTPVDSCTEAMHCLHSCV